jgi:hypothetical protein
MEDIYIGVMWFGLFLFQLLGWLVLMRIEGVIDKSLKAIAQGIAYLLERETPKKKAFKPCKPEDHLWKREQKGGFYCEKCGARP